MNRCSRKRFYIKWGLQNHFALLKCSDTLNYQMWVEMWRMESGRWGYSETCYVIAEISLEGVGFRVKKEGWCVFGCCPFNMRDMIVLWVSTFCLFSLTKLFSFWYKQLQIFYPGFISSVAIVLCMGTNFDFVRGTWK